MCARGGRVPPRLPCPGPYPCGPRRQDRVSGARGASGPGGVRTGTVAAGVDTPEPGLIRDGSRGVRRSPRSSSCNRRSTRHNSAPPRPHQAPSSAACFAVRRRWSRASSASPLNARSPRARVTSLPFLVRYVTCARGSKLSERRVSAQKSLPAACQSWPVVSHASPTTQASADKETTKTEVRSSERIHAPGSRTALQPVRLLARARIPKEVFS